MRCLVAILLLPSLLLGAAAAWAHAFLDHASPAVGSTVRMAPREVAVWLTQEIEPAFSTLEVLDAAGRRVDQGNARVEAGDATELRVALKPLSPGVYKVVWRVVSIDTHATDGDFTFRIAP